MHDFNGHEVNGIHGLHGKKGYDEALYSLNKRHDITGIHDINGNFPYDDIFRKNHARLYFHYVLFYEIILWLRAWPGRSLVLQC